MKDIKHVGELILLDNIGEVEGYALFSGHTNNSNKVNKTCFSQWWSNPDNSYQFHDNDNNYYTAEHYMMFKKAKLFNDNHSAFNILNSQTPAIAKSLGRKVQKFDQSVWDDKCFEIVVEGNMLKFSQNEYMREVLLKTHNDIIVEASPWDKIWGIGLNINDSNCYIPRKWKGTNLLGFALMEVRNRI